MKEIKKFIEQLFKNLPKTEENNETIQKLTETLEEKVEDLKEQGVEEEDAIHKAIVEFGELDDFYAPFILKEQKRYKRQKTLHHYRNDLFFSAVASLLIIGVFIFVYFAFIPWRYWFILPTIGILFWPLSLLYKLLNKKGE